MDCDEARRLLSGAQDREPLHDATAASVAAHCRSCPECARYDAQLGMLDELSSPKAPDELTDRVLALVALEAQADAQRRLTAASTAALPAKGAAPATSEPASASGRFAAFLERLSGPRLLVATGAVTMVAFALAGALALQMRGTPGTVDATYQEAARAGGAPAAAAPTTPAPKGLASSGEAPGRAPDYVSWQGAVYAVAPSSPASGSALTTAGVLTSALGGATPVSLPVLRAGTGDTSIYIVAPGGVVSRCDPVTRLRKGVSFQLRAEQGLARFGLWPDLPANLTRPTSANGSPAFTPAGTDDAGVPIFVRIGDAADRGFAVAPGTSRGDPAAGNPNWTWWAPVP